MDNLQSNQPQKPRKRISMGTTWSEIAPILLALLQTKGPQRRFACDEVKRMAQAADQWNALCDKAPKA